MVVIVIVMSVVNGTKGLDEIYDDGTVSGVKVTVPVDMNGDVSLKEWALVVLKDNWVGLNQSQHAIEGCGFPCVWVDVGLDEYEGGHNKCKCETQMYTTNYHC